MYWVCVARFATRGGICKKLLEAAPMSDGANARQLQDGPVAGQGRAHH